MKTRPLCVMLAVLAVGTSAACNREEPAPTSTAQAPATEPTQPTTTQQPTDDASITTSVQAKYYADDAVRGDDISVTTDEGVVTLQGSVESEADKSRAVTLARDVPGVTRVDDQLRVETTTAGATAPRDPSATPTDATGTSGATPTREPAWITTKIQAQYFVSPEIKPWNIDVTTRNNGVVMLEGEVDTADDKTEAVRIARETEGVTRVDDRLRVKGETDRTAEGTAPSPVPNLTRPDAWLTAKVQSKYFLDDEVKGHEINVDTNESVVTLTGTVETEAQRRQAIALARSTEGVTDVVDQLKLAPDTDAGNQPGAGVGEAARETDIDRPDAWITMKIQSKYFLDDEVKGHRIDVDTVEGVVTLKGNVATDELKREAEQIAKNTAGVTRVVNQLTVKPSQG